MWEGGLEVRGNKGCHSRPFGCIRQAHFSDFSVVPSSVGQQQRVVSGSRRSGFHSRWEGRTRAEGGWDAKEGDPWAQTGRVTAEARKRQVTMTGEEDPGWGHADCQGQVTCGQQDCSLLVPRWGEKAEGHSVLLDRRRSACPLEEQEPGTYPSSV